MKSGFAAYSHERREEMVSATLITTLRIRELHKVQASELKDKLEQHSLLGSLDRTAD